MSSGDATDITERERATLRLPPDIMRRCRMAAAAEGVSMNAYLATTLDTALPHYEEAHPAPAAG